MQTVGLIQAQIERNGIATVSISLLKEVTEIIKPPRALFVPFKMGYPLGEPLDTEFQTTVILKALGLLSLSNTPVLLDF